MNGEGGSNYFVARHAPVHGDDDVLWVAIARWIHADGSTEWCLEYWDDRGEADFDRTVRDEAAAIAQANEEFGLTDGDWRPGPQPFARSDQVEP